MPGRDRVEGREPRVEGHLVGARVGARDGVRLLVHGERDALDAGGLERVEHLSRHQRPLAVVQVEHVVAERDLRDAVVDRHRVDAEGGALRDGTGHRRGEPVRRPVQQGPHQHRRDAGLVAQVRQVDRVRHQGTAVADEVEVVGLVERAERELGDHQAGGRRADPPLAVLLDHAEVHPPGLVLSRVGPVGAERPDEPAVEDDGGAGSLERSGVDRDPGLGRPLLGGAGGQELPGDRVVRLEVRRRAQEPLDDLLRLVAGRGRSDVDVDAVLALRRLSLDLLHRPGGRHADAAGDQTEEQENHGEQERCTPHRAAPAESDGDDAACSMSCGRAR